MEKDNCTYLEFDEASFDLIFLVGKVERKPNPRALLRPRAWSAAILPGGVSSRRESYTSKHEG